MKCDGGKKLFTTDDKLYLHDHNKNIGTVAIFKETHFYYCYYLRDFEKSPLTFTN